MLHGLHLVNHGLPLNGQEPGMRFIYVVFVLCGSDPETASE